MAVSNETSDRKVLELLRQFGALTVSQLVDKLGVTATAVRQRLERLGGVGWVEKFAIREGRGRPSHQYRLTSNGKRELSHNLGDLAMILWSEIRQIEDSQIRQELLNRVSRRLAELYGGQVAGESMSQRLDSLVRVLRQNNFPVTLEKVSDAELPVLRINGCPYPDLSREGHDICDVETKLFSELLGDPINLTECRCHSTDGLCTYVAPSEST